MNSNHGNNKGKLAKNDINELRKTLVANENNLKNIMNFFKYPEKIAGLHAINLKLQSPGT